jgi:hypothetical protein
VNENRKERGEAPFPVIAFITCNACFAAGKTCLTGIAQIIAERMSFFKVNPALLWG